MPFPFRPARRLQAGEHGVAATDHRRVLFAAKAAARLERHLAVEEGLDLVQGNGAVAVAVFFAVAAPSKACSRCLVNRPWRASRSQLAT